MVFRTASLLAIVASLVSVSQSYAAFITHTAPASFNTAVSGLTNVGSTNFGLDATGNKGTSFSSGGIGFAGSTQTVPAGPIALAVLSDVGPDNTLGTNGGFGDFVGGAAPAIGDVLTISVPAGSRALGLNILTNIPPDTTSFARLTIDSTSVDMFLGQPGTNVPGGGGFNSYFLGISGALAGDTFTTATVSFVGGGSAFRVDNVNVFSAIPEPGSMALAAVAGIAGLVRRRVRRS